MGKKLDLIWDNINSLWKELELLKEKQPTTVKPTQTAHTPDNQWPVEEYTNPGMNPSWQSVQVDTPSGLVEHNLECVHQWVVPSASIGYSPIPKSGDWCRKCGALWWFDKIRVPDVHLISSTSQKQPLSKSVENSAEGSVKSLLKGLIESFKGLANFKPETPRHDGYIEGLLVAQSWIEMKIRELDRIPNGSS